MGSWRERFTRTGSASVSATCSATASLTPAWSNLRRLRSNAMETMEGMSASHSRALSTLPPAGDSAASHVIPALRRSSASISTAGSAPARSRSPALRTRTSRLSGIGASGRWRRSTAYVNSSPCQGAPSAGGGGRVHQLQHVAEAEAAAVGVVLQQGPLVVQAGDRVGDAALDGLGDGAPEAGRPVGQCLAGLVGAHQGRVDHLAGVAVGARVHPRLGSLQSGHDRGRAHVRLLAQPPDHAGQPLKGLDGDLMDGALEARVAVAGRFVEGVLADHVGHGRQEQLGPGVTRVSGGASWVCPDGTCSEDTGRGHRGGPRAG